MNFFNKLINTFVSERSSMYSENKILITGLGNIGGQYFKTRHNAGFLAAEEITEKFQGFFIDGRYGQTCMIKIKNKQVILFKPSTFMNLSGKGVKYYIEKEKIKPENFLVICDDIALPFGLVRIRKKGGAGGHNGLQSIIDALGSSEFPRIRIGIGNDFAKGYQSEYVLGEWSEQQLQHLPGILKHTVSACETYILEGIDQAMNKFNKKDIK